MSLRREKLLVSVALGGGFYLIFHFVAAWGSQHARPAPAWLITPLDRALPTVPWSVWVYISWYPATALGLLADRTMLRTFYLSYACAFALCIPWYFLLPIGIERSIPAGSEGLSADMLRRLYTFDPPVNLFPSYHAAIAAILTGIGLGSRAVRWALAAWMTAVCVSCVLTKQHYVLDVVAGVGVGVVALLFVRRMVPRVTGRSTAGCHVVCSCGRNAGA